MARTHSVATIVVDATDQQGLGFGARRRVIVQLLTELVLDRIEEITTDDGWLLARQDLAFEGNLANVEPVAEQVSEGTAGEWDTSDRPPALERPHLGDDPAFPEVGHQPVEAAKLEIA